MKGGKKKGMTCTQMCLIIQGVPLAIKPGMKILQRNLNRSMFIVWEMKRNVSVVRQIVAARSSNILIGGKIIKEMPGSVASGTHSIILSGSRMKHLLDQSV